MKHGECFFRQGGVSTDVSHPDYVALLLSYGPPRLLDATPYPVEELVVRCHRGCLGIAGVTGKAPRIAETQSISRA